MTVNYKFQLQIKTPRLSLYLDDSCDLEISSFKRLSDFDDVKDLIDDAKSIYFNYYGYSNDLLATHLNIQDLNFLLFLEEIRNSNFDNINFTGDFVNLVGRHGKEFAFSFLVNEG